MAKSLRWLRQKIPSERSCSDGIFVELKRDYFLAKNGDPGWWKSKKSNRSLIAGLFTGT
jgi:hypothetical protein